MFIHIKINRILKVLFSCLVSVMIILICVAVFSLPTQAYSDTDSSGELLSIPLDNEHTVCSVGHYANWAGVSSVAQFTDEKGQFCFAYDGDQYVTVVKTEYGRVTEEIIIEKLYPLFGTALCDNDGNIYVVWGRENTGSDTNEETIFISKYNRSGNLISTVGGDGSEGLAWYYDADFNTKIPFDAGNCDAAISGRVLLVNYAREMYSGHQSNGIFAINIDTMAVLDRFVYYNSHSFDQRVTPYSKTGGFLLESHGDCFPRTFSTAVTGKSSMINTFDSFNFWVEKDAYKNYNMWQLNATYARLGNILETSRGAALVGASAKSLSSDAVTQPYDLFVQVFDPRGNEDYEDSYITSGVRSGLAGNNGDTETIDYGVNWLTDLAGSGKTVGTVQAITTDEDNIVILYELYSTRYFDSTWYMVLDSSGEVIQPAISLGKVRLNLDEDPVFSKGSVKWISNKYGSDQLVLYSLIIEPSSDEFVQYIVQSENAINLHMSNQWGGMCTVALYDSNTRLLAVSSKVVEKNAGEVSISYPGSAKLTASETKVFFFDALYKPLYECVKIKHHI